MALPAGPGSSRRICSVTGWRLLVLRQGVPSRGVAADRPVQEADPIDGRIPRVRRRHLDAAGADTHLWSLQDARRAVRGVAHPPASPPQTGGPPRTRTGKAVQANCERRGGGRRAEASDRRAGRGRGTRTRPGGGQEKDRAGTECPGSCRAPGTRRADESPARQASDGAPSTRRRRIRRSG